MPPKHALALCKQKILRFWGLTAQRGWAHLIMGRFRDLVLSPAIQRSQRASQTPLHMSTKIYSFQTLGVAPLTILASAGGMAEASKCPFLLSGSPAVLELYWWLSDKQKHSWQRKKC
jgi:hypothetical protein